MKYAEFQELHTPRLYLRKISMEDLRDYYRFTGDPEVTRYMLFRTHQDLSEAAASIEKWTARYSAGRCYHWGIALRENDQLIGIIDLLHFRQEDSTCSFAYLLGKAFWGRGYMTEALRAVMEFGFSQLELERMEADHIAENAASGAVMRKVGMSCRGTIPGKYEKDNSLHDAVGYAITREEWQKAQETPGTFA